MKIRIKKTNEVLEDVKFIDTTLSTITIQYLDDGVPRECVVKNLSDIEEVKDYEEPEKCFWIDTDGFIVSRNIFIKDVAFETFKKNLKSIGNYFETKEEAERAREKLKAWKRLKDKGIRFGGHDDRDRGQLGDIVIYAEMPTFEYDDDSTREDLDLLFLGGKE